MDLDEQLHTQRLPRERRPNQDRFAAFKSSPLVRKAARRKKHTLLCLRRRLKLDGSAEDKISLRAEVSTTRDTVAVSTMSSENSEEWERVESFPVSVPFYQWLLSFVWPSHH